MSISHATLLRLPRYFRYIRELLGCDVLRISSTELASMMGLNVSQVRSDLSSIGQLGQQGYGYNVRELYDNIADVLGIKNGYDAIIIGSGNICLEIVHSNMIKGREIRLRGIFDYYSKVGEKISDIEIKSITKLEGFLKENKIDIAILCVEKELCCEACSIAVDGGVRGIWNLTQGEIRADKLPAGVKIVNLNIFDSLGELFGLLSEAEDK